MESIDTYLGLILLFIVLSVIQIEQIYKEQKRHNQELERISKEQRDLLQKN